MDGRLTRVTIVGSHGIEPVQELLGGLPERCGFAVLVATADPPAAVSGLSAAIKMSVVQAIQDQPLEHDRVYVIPTGKEAIIRGGQLRLSQASFPGLQLDRLLRSAADELGRESIAVILRGAGTDGAIGLKRIKEAGGLAFTEEPPIGALGEMPRAAIDTGMIDQIVAPAKIAALLCQVGGDAETSDGNEERGDRESSDTLRDILTMVRVRSGHDFSGYKRATLFRRVARRMQMCQTPSIADYLQVLRDRPPELAHLLRDFLISVTNFFRDPDAYAALDTRVLTPLFEDRRTAEPIRIWVAGCATGEEAYSLGILLLEHAARHPHPPELQIFATDIDEEALTEARAGRYPETIAVDVSPERLQRFFVKDAGYYRVSTELREIVLFSPHNLLRDPPFSRLDLVSCRNLLIYLNRDAQQRVLSVFHFATRADGSLFLGSSESAEASALFSAVDSKHRIFTRQTVGGSFGIDALPATPRWYPPVHAPVRTAPNDRPASLGEVHHKLVERYAPPSLLVSGELEILHLSEHAGKFLEVAGGEPTRHVLRMIHPGLRLDLRTAIHAARQPGRGYDTRRVSFEDEGRQRTVELRVRLLDLPDLGPQALLIYLDECDVRTAGPANDEGTGAMFEPVVREMEEELHRTRDQLRMTIEQYETSLEELKASNEELQAMNEELRSASEELETSKEELQSVNEELTTLNHELKVKVDEVSHANSDLQNLMTSTEIAVVFLDRNLNVKRFTPRSLDVFNLIPSDIGRPLAHITNRLDTDELPGIAERVLKELRTIERDASSRDGRRYLVRVLPYRSLEERIEGVVMTFVDVSDLRAAVDARLRTEAALETSEARLRVALRGAPVFVLGLHGASITWGYVLGKELTPGELEALDVFSASEAARLGQLAAETALTGQSRRAEIELRIAGVPRTYDVRIEPTGREVTAVGFDITTSKEGEAALREADRRKDEFIATLSHELRNPLTPLKVALDVARLAKGDPDKLESSQRIMERQVMALSALVDELLDLSRIAKGKLDLDLQAIDLAEFIEPAIESTRPLFDELGHELTVELPSITVKVNGDARRLSQVLANLLTNAAKYTPHGHGKISLSAMAERTRHTLVIRVRDNGIGIPQQLLPRIFDIFVQGQDDGGRQRGGLGIGLSLVKRLVDLHGGRVYASSAGADQGTEFAVELPLAR